MTPDPAERGNSVPSRQLPKNRRFGGIDEFRMESDSSTREPVVTIGYERLLEVFELLITHIRSTRPGDTAAIEDDYFWSIPITEMTDVYSNPISTIGQFSESWENIEKSIAQDILTPYDLIWFADILRAVAREAMD